MDYEGPLQVAAGTAGNHRFGTLLKAMREHSNLSPQELADEAEVHVSFVRGIERGVQAPSVATARLLLACMTDQDSIQWRDGTTYDLLLRDPETGRDVAFEFKAKLKGQNRRPGTYTDWAVAKAFEVTPRDEALIKLLEAKSPAELAALTAPVIKALERAKTTEARFGRVVRLLALADSELLGQVENLLRTAMQPPGPSAK